jgi:hypothetical protein
MRGCLWNRGQTNAGKYPRRLKARPNALSRLFTSCPPAIQGLPQQSWIGGVAEWSIASDSKSDEPQGSGGSNPFPSARLLSSTPNERITMPSFKISTVNFFRCLCLWGALLAAAPGALLAADEVRQKVAEYQSKGYNVLFIAVDDMNDWVGCFGGIRRRSPRTWTSWLRKKGSS